MPNKITRYSCLAVGVLLSTMTVASAAELNTLFTTQKERQLINSNRYKSDQPKTVEKVEQQPLPDLAIQQLVREEVSQEYKVSGITISREGPHVVWINSVSYEDGEQLEDSSKIKVYAGEEIKVRITAPDGKHYFASSGETLDVTYLSPVER